MKLSDAAYDGYRTLIRSATFYVVDTEYTRPDTDDPVRSSRLISIAVIPVTAGVKGAPLYVEMNPTVPVSAVTTAKTGFTTENTERKRPFSFYAQRIVDAFADRSGVWVSHTSSDLRVLLGELERNEAAGNTPGPADMANLRMADTAVLPRLLTVPGLPSSTGTVSLADLCKIVGVPFNPDKAHDARYDAKAAADALLELLTHAAAAGRVDLDGLLDDHRRGTVHAPTRSGTYTSVPDTHPPLPPDHVARHGHLTLGSSPDDEQVRAFTELAAECIQLRCQYLDDEAEAATDAAAAVLPPLWELLDGCSEAGQAGTLLGAVAVLLPTGVDSSRMVRWWADHKAAVTAAEPCGRTQAVACPACRSSESCPVDVLYTTVARQAALCGRPSLTKQTVKYKLFSAPGKKDRRVSQWAVHHPELAGYMAAMVVNWERDNNGASFAAKYLGQAVDLGLAEVEPRLGLLWVEELHASGRVDEARCLVATLLERETTDEAFIALRLWVDRLDQYDAATLRRAEDIAPTQRPRMVRPRNRVNPNPYRVYDLR